ncbi:MAG: phospholipid carrier-dependent glycosyltransferase [Alphaproteobacteria bacterium]|jgi:4-amino-4-deoxy-L-arabinose transferase-like glycosyltransferase|nr:phospholipid carrier-dependent glycosyltransferase [Alphaproteobacteria bacterium]
MLSRLMPPALIAMGWAVLFLPAAALRGLHYEEGRRALAAMNMLAEGNWLLPAVLDVPYLNKPPLLPWLIAGAGWLLGAVGEWAVRLPPLLATLAGGLLVYGLAARLGGRTAGLFGAAAFLLSPMILEKAAVGETDVTVTVTLFAGFLLWWLAAEGGRVPAWAWAGCALCLALAALAKGPIPLAFFAVGVGGMSLLAGRARDLLPLAGALSAALLALGAWALAVYEPGNAAHWQSEMRLNSSAGTLLSYLIARVELVGELLAMWSPWLWLALPLFVPAWRRRLGLDGESRTALALGLYAFGFLPVLLLWPDSLPRYAMPAVPALAVAAGLVAARLWALRPRRVRPALAAVVAVMAVGQVLVATGVVPLRAELYAYARPAGAALGAAMRADPAPAYFSSVIGDHNIMLYTGEPIREVPVGRAGRIAPPAWIVTTPEALPALRRRLPALPRTPAAEAVGRRGQPFWLMRLPADDAAPSVLEP